MSEERHDKLWLTASPQRVIAEALVASCVIWIASVPFTDGTTFPMRIRNTVVLLLLVGPFCALWAAARLRRQRGPMLPRLLTYGAMGMILSVVPTAIVTRWIFNRVQLPGDVRPAVDAQLNSIPVWVFIVIALVAFSLEFVVIRLGVYLWLMWNNLRRRHLRWALTHAQLSLVVLGAGLLFATLMVTHISNPPNLFFYLVPLLVLLTIPTALAILVLLSPAALFSYVFIRPITRRLETLAAATAALRRGNYATRVPVAGEDEVAQLQSDFNAMAADLELAVEELRVQRDTVTRLLESRRELVANVSHELRTPVATMRGYLESTRVHWDTSPPPTLRHDLDIIEREVIRLQGLIDDLFTLSRAEMGKLALRCRAVDVSPLAKRVVETRAPLAWRADRVEMIADVPDIAMTMADPNRLEQVLENLLHNGLRHTPPGGIVALAVHTAPDGVVLEVKDTGEGIAADELPRIWERFYRTESARARTESGTGLGLALVKELTESMGGTVAAASTPGQGSCFTIRLPSAPSGAVTPGDESTTPRRETPARAKSM